MALTLLAAAWVLGLAVGWAAPLPSTALALWAVAALALWGCLVLRAGPAHAFAEGPPRMAVWGLLATTALLAGLWWGGASDDAAPKPLPTHDVAFHALVVSDPREAGATYRLEVEPRPSAVDAAAALPDRVLVTLRPGSTLVRQRDAPYFRYGDVLRLEGTLEMPPRFADFDYQEYLARQGIAAVMSFPRATLVEEGQGSWALGRVYALRHRLAESLQEALPQPQAALAQAVSLGIRGDLPDGVREDFLETGTGHLLAISGLHVGVLLGVALAASRAALGGGRWYLLAPLLLLWLYALLSGMAPPVVRASIMGTLFLAARFSGRPGAGLPALSVAAGVMAGLDPSLLRDVSFQLSFTAMAGLLIVAPPIEAHLNALLESRLADRGPLPRWSKGLAAALAVGVAATVATLPLLAFTFHRISLLGIPATMLALPALPPMLVGSALTGALGLVWGPLGSAAGIVTWVPLSYVLEFVAALDALPSETFDAGAGAPWVVAAYYALLLRLPAGRTLMRFVRMAARGDVWRLRGFRVPFRWAAPALAMASALLWAGALSAPDGKLRVTFLDVGQGDATLIVTPSGRQVLVDGGPDQAAMQGLGARLPFWDRSLDVVALTHPHGDHVNGLLEVLQRYDADIFLHRSAVYPTAEYARWEQALADHAGQSVVLEAQRGHRIDLGDGVVLEVLHPGPITLDGETNNNSLVLRLSYGRVAFLLTGDVETPIESALGARGASLDAAVLKVGHHGSDSSTSAPFLEAVSPSLAVISVGEDNRFGHPNDAVLDRLRARLPHDRVLLTSQHGDVQVTTDGRRLWLKTAREAGPLDR